MSRSPGYGWVIDTDHIAESPEYSRVGTMGPSGIPTMIREDFERGAACLEFKRWRCKDGDGEVYYEGRYIGPGDERMFGPLQDFATPDAGASDIEYLNTDTGQWEAL